MDILSNPDFFTGILGIFLLWCTSSIILDRYERVERRKKLWTVSKHFPEKNLQGEIVKINNEHNGIIEIRALSKRNNGYLMETNFNKNYFNTYLKEVKNIKEG